MMQDTNSTTASRIVTLLLVAAVVATPMVASLAVADANSAPSGMATVPSDQISDNIPQHAQDRIPFDVQALVDGMRGNTVTSAHADDLHATVTVSGPSWRNADLALQLSDNANHEGRRVGLPADALERALGYKPTAAYGHHESGDRWVAPINYQGGYAVFKVPKFSTNTVTFSGHISVSATPATDGSTITYDIEDHDSASNFTLDVTGHTATESESVSKTGVSDGGSVALNIAGNLDPTGPSANNKPTVTFTGVTQSTDRSVTDTTGDDDLTSVTVDGNADPTGPSANNKPLLTVNSVNRWSTTESGLDTTSSGTARYLSSSPSPIGWINITSSNWGASNSKVTYDVYVASGNTTGDGNYTDGTLCGTVTVGGDTYSQEDQVYCDVSNTGHATIEFNRTDAHAVGNGEVVDAEIYGDDPGTVTFVDNSGGDTVGLTEGESKEINLTPETSDIQTIISDRATVNWTLQYTDRTKSEDPSVDVDGDGVDDASYTGLLNDGETQTVEIAPTVDDDSMTVSTANGSVVDVDVSLEERTQTVDPKICVNENDGGGCTSHTGSLADGTTQQLNPDTSWLRNGTNHINVSVGDGSLGADAPTPSVDVAYSHDIVDNQTVNYLGEKWTERYNVSRTYRSEQSDAEVAIPFDSTAVVEIRDVEHRINESGGWSAVSESDWSLSGTTLTVDLNGVYGGSIPPDTTVEVRANGSKVSANNATITVLEPTTTGNSLDSKIRVDSWADDSYIAVNGSQGGDLIHYAYNESYSGADEYFEADADGNRRMHLPNVKAGGTARLSTIPVKATPETGEVLIEVESPKSQEPEFVVRPGSSTDDDVKFTFTDAQDGETYLLYSKTNEIVRDEGTASSPITLVDDDSSETLQFQLDTSDDSGDSGDTGGGGPGGGGGTGPLQSTTQASPFSLPLTIFAVVGSVILLVLVSRRVDDGPATETTTSTLGRIPVAGKYLAGLVRAPLRLALGNQTVLLGVGAIIALLALQSGIVGVPPVVQGVIALVVALAGVAVALRRTGNFDPVVWGTLSLLAFVGIAEWINPGVLLGPFGSGLGQGALILGLGVLYLGYRWLKTRQQPDKQVNIQLQDDSGGDGS